MAMRDIKWTFDTPKPGRLVATATVACRWGCGTDISASGAVPSRTILHSVSGALARKVEAHQNHRCPKRPRR